MIKFAKPALMGISFLGVLALGTALPVAFQDELREISLFNCDIDVRPGSTTLALTDIFWKELDAPKFGVELTIRVPVGVSLSVGSTKDDESYDLAAGFDNIVVVEYERAGPWGEQIKVTVKTTSTAADDKVFTDKITRGEIDPLGPTLQPYLIEARSPSPGVERARLWVLMYGLEYALTLTG